MLDRQILRDYLSAQNPKGVPFGDDDSLLLSKALDSLKTAELVVFLEDRFKVTLDGDDVTPDNLDTINAIAGFLERKLAAAAGTP